MKQYSTLLLLLLLLSINSAGQGTPFSKEQSSSVLQQSRRNQTAAWSLLAAGSVMMVVGGISVSETDFWNDQSDVPYFTFLLGTGCMVASIPFFVVSGTQKQKSSKLSSVIRMEKSRLFPNKTYAFPSIGLRYMIR